MKTSPALLQAYHVSNADGKRASRYEGEWQPSATRADRYQYQMTADIVSTRKNFPTKPQ